MPNPLPPQPKAALVSRDDLLFAFADFLSIDVSAGDAATDTLQTYRRQVEQFLKWCDRHDLDPAQLDKNDIKRYRHWLINVRGFKPATIALKLSVVRRFYQAAVEHRLLPINPALGVKPPREKRDPAERITFLEKAEVEKLLASVPQGVGEPDPVRLLQVRRDRALLAIMALEGPRTVELHRANVSNIIQQGQHLGIRVEGKRNIRIVPLTPEIGQILMDYLQTRRDQGENFTPTTPYLLLWAIGPAVNGSPGEASD